MQIYKTINKINNKWYIGKDSTDRPYYFGSGKILRLAIKKYGKDNFEKIILEQLQSNSSLQDLCIRETYWITLTDAVNDPMSYNLGGGGEGGDLSKYIDYEKRVYNGDRFSAAKKWYDLLTSEEKDKLHKQQGMNRSKVWFVSRIETPEIEIRVINLHQWEINNNIIGIAHTGRKEDPAYGKSCRGWRARLEDDNDYPPFVDKRISGHENIACKGKTWRLIDSKRVWFNKEE